MESLPEKSDIVIREGNPDRPTMNVDEVKTISTDLQPSTPTGKDRKAENVDNAAGNNGKTTTKKKHGKAAKAKQAKKAKKDAATETSSESSSDEDAEASSDTDITDSDVADTRKRVSKKRQNGQGSKKARPPKKAKKPVKTKIEVTPASESDTDSDSDDSSVDLDGQSGDTDPQKARKQHRQFPKDAQQLLEQLTRYMANAQPPVAAAGSAACQPPAYGYGGNSLLPQALSGDLPILQAQAWPRQHPNGENSARLRAQQRASALALAQLGQTSGNMPLNLGHLNAPPAKSKQKAKTAIKIDYKRVDQVWDSSIHNYKLQDTAEASDNSQYGGYLFHVRRTFDWESKYKATIVDIKSKLLRECLQDVMGNVKGVSLVDDTPKIDPNMLFLYLEDIRKYRNDLKKVKPSGADKHERKKDQQRINDKRTHLKVLIKYIDKDYDAIKNSLYPMLENGLITFDLFWALWKPNTLAYTTTYGSHDEPRVFKVDSAEKHHTLMKGEVYHIEGKYFEYDGKQFGYGTMAQEVSEFRGAIKITSLNCYPLKYHKHEARVRKELIERGKKFVSLGGVHYKCHQGMAYFKKKKAIVKINVNGRVMVDPSTHRRINPNYPVSIVRPKDHDILEDDSDSDNDVGCCGGESDSDVGAVPNPFAGNEGEDKIKYVTKVFKDREGKIKVVKVPEDEAAEMTGEVLTQVLSKDDVAEATSDTDDAAKLKSSNKTPEFTDEEYLTASPVVLGFAFGEKLWLELTVSGIKDIQWNEKAYDSLVLRPETKDTVKDLVESHKYHAAERIDDVIQGKGKGLVVVLHGPPGTGKTLTAEGISEFLNCPLYMASAGELGTDSRFLEAELQKILDICHAWGAILLLDEADVFLEKRNMHDIHRNALVSIFLRQLEYFQGILFLTTNRVETFDEAFQSRIHIALRYDPLDARARRAIFRMFVERARVQQGAEQMPFSEEDYAALGRHELNGRQIKNTVVRAQALAVHRGEPLSMAHIRQILDVQVSFDRDLKGGTGYQDAMRSYF